ncbi:hypothetical protein RF55_12667 [Lasius niger]|uniref:Uncharacterized protein n=1 Tax=Lasius niger TaxID=67767 RepID=A0A0J7N5F4_LASNI|nr:hypothetical protein RF55_12667 [Lasius niger]
MFWQEKDVPPMGMGCPELEFPRIEGLMFPPVLCWGKDCMRMLVMAVEQTTMWLLKPKRVSTRECRKTYCDRSVSELQSTKKRKATASPDSSPNGTGGAGSSYFLRSPRKSWIVISSEEENIVETVDLTREPTYSKDGDLEGAASTTAGSSRNEGGVPDRPKRRKNRTGRKVSAAVKKKKSKLNFKETLGDISYEELTGMVAANAGAVGLECINAIRVNSSSFQGTWNNRMWIKIKIIKEVIRAFVAKTELYGDSALLEARVIEKTEELSAAKRDAADRKEENKKLRKENDDLLRTIGDMKSEMKR